MLTVLDSWPLVFSVATTWSGEPVPERRAGDVVRVEERVVRALGLLPPKEPAVLGGREGLAQRRAKGVHVWYRERGHDVAMLARVSKRWQTCLKKHLAVMPAENARLEAHRVFLEDARGRVYNHRVSRFGEPQDSWGDY